MIQSMTGYGRGEVSRNNISARAEVRSVNNRFLEMTVRLPRSLSMRENDAKEIIRKKLARGKINLTIAVEFDDGAELPVKVNASAAKMYYGLLNDLRETVNLEEKVTLAHLLSFSEVFEAPEADETDEKEWAVAEEALNIAIDELLLMRSKEGGELDKDLKMRIKWIASEIDIIEKVSKERLPIEREKLRERVMQIASDPSIIDEKRLEFEMLLLADKLDVTEECVRFRSHNKFFMEALTQGDAAGRKLTFLLQEMNREANTIGSKASDAEISQKVVKIKEELEKVREQLQNIE